MSFSIKDMYRHYSVGWESQRIEFHKHIYSDKRNLFIVRFSIMGEPTFVYLWQTDRQIRLKNEDKNKANI